MQKAEPQKGAAPNQPAARQGGGMALAAPQGEKIAQLEALIESSPQGEKQGALAALINAGSAMTAQHKLLDGIASSPRMDAQRKFGEGIHHSPRMVAQRKKNDSLFGVAQRVEDEEPLQGKLTPEAPARQAAAKSNNTGLPDHLKSGIESLSGLSMDNVKVHYNSSQPAQLNALAYAQGTDIHIAPGQERHLPHEAWHVVQQAQGRVQPTMQMKNGVAVNDDVGLEAEADVMGAKAVQMKGEGRDARSDSVIRTSGKLAGAVVQCVNWGDVEHDRIRVEGEGSNYEAYYDDEKAGELDLYEDGEGLMWINNVSTDANYQSRGIGLSMLEFAVREHGAIYAAVGMQNYEETGDDDTRHLSVEGAALVGSAVRNNILQEGWCYNPAYVVENEFEDEEVDEDFAQLSPHEVINRLARGEMEDYEARQWITANYEDDERESAYVDLMRSAGRL